jgi:hypothetical protein
MMETFMADYLRTTMILVMLLEQGIRFGHAASQRYGWLRNVLSPFAG